MEVRFDRPAKLAATGTTKRQGTAVEIKVEYDGHPEGGRVPASLRRYGRTVGVPLGEDDPAAISPREARQLFLAITKMPGDLRRRINRAVGHGVASPERLCYTLLSGTWRELELDFMLAVSPRVGSIISGGSDWHQRPDRQAESEIARASYMVGMLYQRLNATDNASGDVNGLPGAARVIEDERVGISWRVLEDVGVVVFAGLRSAMLPWQPPDGRVQVGHGEEVAVVPRTFATQDDIALCRALKANFPHVAMLLPRDARPSMLVGQDQLLTLHCPDRLSEIDRAIESKLLGARTSRG
jgi:hypothetical protein